MTKKKREPDKTGRFQKGRSGNPNGRPRGSRNTVTLLVENLILDDASAIVAKLITAAKKGNITAAVAVLRTIMGPARERSLPIQFKLPQIKNAADAATAMSQIIKGCAAGKLDGDQARSLVSVLESFTKTYAASEFEARLAALETKRNS